MKRFAFILAFSTVVVMAGFVFLANLGGQSSNLNRYIVPFELSFNKAEAATCNWSTGYYLDKGKIKSNPFSTGECVWYVDGKERNNGWTLYSSRGSSRNAYQFKDKIVVDKNGNKMGYGTIGYPGEIMVFNSDSKIKGFGNGHVAYITSRGYAHDGKRRAWTVRHANFGTGTGQYIVKNESPCGVTITQCTFVEDPAGSGKLKVVLGSDKKGNEILGGTGFPLLGFIYKK